MFSDTRERSSLNWRKNTREHETKGRVFSCILAPVQTRSFPRVGKHTNQVLLISHTFNFPSFDTILIVFAFYIPTTNHRPKIDILVSLHFPTKCVGYLCCQLPGCHLVAMVVTRGAGKTFRMVYDSGHLASS